MHDVKNTCNYKHFPLHGTHWCIKRLREKIHNDYNKIELFWNFYQLPRIYASLFKTKYKTVWIKFRKTLQERRLPISKFSQDNPQNNFLNFLTSRNIFIALQYSGDILRIFLKQTFIECSSNILEKLLRDYWNLPKDQYLLLSNHTFLTQTQLFHRELIKKSFPLKYSLNVPWMSRTLQLWGNTQQISPEYCVPTGSLIWNTVNMLNKLFSPRFLIGEINCLVRFISFFSVKK